VITWPFKTRMPVDVQEMLYRLKTRGREGTREYRLTEQEKARMKAQIYMRLGLGES
jgi:hypothetical protein